MPVGSESPVFQLKNISKRFGGLVALDQIDLSISTGQIMGLIGPNGAGKSTLFHVATSFLKPDTGDIFVQGKKMTGKSPHAICRMGISRTFQREKSFPGLTVFDNVMVGAVFGNPRQRKNASREAMAALELVGLEGKKMNMAGRMTLSERRLLEVARALASRPVVTLLDEPMAGLNPSETLNMLQVIEKARRKRNLAVLWVEHKVEAVFRLCDRVAVLDYGKKIGEGTPEEIAKNKQVIEAYLGKPAARS